MHTYKILTENWNRVVAIPYLIFMPEKDRLLMLVSCDYPHRPFVLWSDDRGATWTEPMGVEGISEDPAHHIGVGLTDLGGGKAAFTVVGNIRYFSEDFGWTWNPIPIAPPAALQDWQQWDPFLVDRDPVTGRIDRIWETAWKYTGPWWRPQGGLGPVQAYLRSSTDEARTWTPALAVPEWEESCEVALIRAANGDLIAACRTAVPEEYNLNIPDVDEFCGLGISISADNGQTWSKVNLLYAWGRHHPCMVLMPNGDIVMTYVVRRGYPDTADGYPQFGIEAVISRDHGRTWDLEHRVVLVEYAGNRKSENAWWPAPQCTSTVLLPDGTLLTAFGTGYRSQPNEKNMAAPRDIGLVRWTPEW